MNDVDAVNLGLLIFRVAVGTVFLAHGYNHIWGGGKIDGTAGWFASLGMKPGKLHAWLASAVEVVGGVMLLVGFLMPLAGASVTGVMLVAWIINHRKNGFFIFRPGEGYEYVMTLTAAGFVLAIVGAGEWSIDHLMFDGDLVGVPGLVAALVGGVGGGLGLLAAFSATGEAKARGHRMTDLEEVSAAAAGRLGFAAFDADNHYYEAPDAFTRHVDPAMAQRCVQWCEIGGRKHHVVGGRVSRAVSNPTFDPIAPPGALVDYFRGNPDGANPLDALSRHHALPPEFMSDRDAWVDRIHGFGLDAVWLFPTLGMLYEQLLVHDPEAICHTFGAFNRWVAEDWGFAYRDTIFAAPYLSLADVGWACDELDWAIAGGARTIVMRTAAVPTVGGLVNPFDDRFDPFWSKVNDAGITVVVHAGDSGRTSNGYSTDGFSASFSAASSGGWRPSLKLFDIERAAEDWLLEFMFARMPERFPNLRIASVENGSGFLRDLFAKLDSQHHKMLRAYWSEHPAELFRRHVWINPFWEDRLTDVIDLMGADRVIFGSDWPHIEGMPEPLDYVTELDGLDDSTRRLVMRDNARSLNERRPPR